jgi:hypothetical protein
MVLEYFRTASSGTNSYSFEADLTQKSVNAWMLSKLGYLPMMWRKRGAH